MDSYLVRFRYAVPSRIFCRRTFALAIALGSICSVRSIDAQVSGGPVHFWGGVGYGSFGCYKSFSCDAHEAREAQGAMNGFAGLGGSITPSLIAGLELNARSKTVGELTKRLQSASTVLRVYPLRSTGLHFKGSVGICSLSRSGQFVGDDIILSDERSTGAIGSVGVGYDLALSPRLRLSPAFEIGATSINQVANRLWESRIGLTWH